MKTVTLTDEDIDTFTRMAEECYETYYEAARLCDHESDVCKENKDEPSGWLCRFDKASDRVGALQAKIDGAA